MDEVEIKFWVKDKQQLVAKARQLGFMQKTEATHELNTLYDTPDRNLRQEGKLLRLRRYGKKCKLTHKSRPEADTGAARFKTRIELETEIADCGEMDEVLRALGFQPCFTYEKYRAEWSDGKGELVIDETPIGTLAELEGPPRWIDHVAGRLGVDESEYMTTSYGMLFVEWQKEHGGTAKNMTFAEMGAELPERFRASAGC